MTRRHCKNTSYVTNKFTVKICSLVVSVPAFEIRRVTCGVGSILYNVVTCFFLFFFLNGHVAFASLRHAMTELTPPRILFMFV